MKISCIFQGERIKDIFCCMCVERYIQMRSNQRDGLCQLFTYCLSVPSPPFNTVLANVTNYIAQISFLSGFLLGSADN